VNLDKNRTNENFHIAFKDLKEKLNLSLGHIAIKTGLSKSFLSDIMNNKVLPPKDEFIERIALVLEVEPDYFFEYRLRRLTEFIRENRDFLDEYMERKLEYERSDEKQ
jgi:transcriptional regulator with XRE-family HTH domain